MKKRIPPGPGQESVWDYPRPPKLEPTTKHLKVFWKDQLLASTNSAFRVLETSHPPVYYIPPNDIDWNWLRADEQKQSFCEWKGTASYWNIISPEGQMLSKAAAWSYAKPSINFAPIQHFLAFYPSRVTACYVNDERVQAQAGDFYGGWITKDIVGPFKGEPGTWGW